MLPSMRLLRPAILLAAILLSACTPEAIAGTDLGKQPAPEFTLTDAESGAPVSLSSFRGNVVALAFLYTRCPDVCPLTAEHFRQAQGALEADARVQFVAVSVDPEGDTPASVREFSASHRLSRDWHYLVGPKQVLSPVWSAYGVRSEPDPSGLVGHTDAIFLIDRRGQARVLLHTVDGAEALTKDIRILLREAG